MNPPQDLAPLLREWPDQPGRMNVRLVRLEGGRVVLQRRVPLGVFQMETTGRPDGLRPGGRESLLADFRTRWENGRPRPSAEELEAAEREAALYLHRAVAMAALAEFESVIRDAEHVRHLAQFLGADGTAGASRGLAGLCIQALLLAIRADVAMALRDRGASGAVDAIDRGLAELESMLERSGSIAPVDGAGVEALRALRATLVPKLPSSQREELRRRLEAAIATENFELAAILRNELRQLGP